MSSPVVKLVAQVFIAGILVLLGVLFLWFPWPGGTSVVMPSVFTSTSVISLGRAMGS